MNEARRPNWSSITASAFPWEGEALDYVRCPFPEHEPYRAWSNFEFIANDGSVNEVDVLIFTPQGFFLTETKGRPGVLTGDMQTGTWRHEGRSTVVDNPVFLEQPRFSCSEPRTSVRADSRKWLALALRENRCTESNNAVANQKAKKLATLLQQQRAFGKLRVPFIEPLVFCSAENVQSQLQGNART